MIGLYDFEAAKSTIELFMTLGSFLSFDHKADKKCTVVYVY